MGIKIDDSCMMKYLDKVIVTGLQDLELSGFYDYVTAGAPVLDFLAVYQENMAA